MNRVVVCTSRRKIATQLGESLGTGWSVQHAPIPTAIGDAYCVVTHMEDPNAVAMADNALDANRVSISIVETIHQRHERLSQGDFDAFQVHCLDVHVLAARLEQGLARSRLKKERRAKLEAN